MIWRSPVWSPIIRICWNSTSFSTNLILLLIREVPFVHSPLNRDMILPSRLTRTHIGDKLNHLKSQIFWTLPREDCCVSIASKYRFEETPLLQTFSLLTVYLEIASIIWKSHKLPRFSQPPLFSSLFPWLNQLIFCAWLQLISLVLILILFGWLLLLILLNWPWNEFAISGIFSSENWFQHWSLIPATR
jgi:hypothetical protein